MSLNWNVLKIKDQSKAWVKCGSKQEAIDRTNIGGFFQPSWAQDPKTKQWLAQDWKTFNLIFALGRVGFNSVTEKNYKEIFLRLDVVQKADEPFMRKRNKDTKEITPNYFTLKDVRDRIGLWTNHSLYSRTEFFKRLYKELSAAADREELKLIEKPEAATNGKN